MKGYRQTKKLMKGLKRRSSDPWNSSFFTQALGILIEKNGIELLPTLSNPLTGLTVSHPLPQLVSLQRRSFLITATGLYEVNADWTKTLLLSITSTKPGHFADFGSYIVFTNGSYD
mgnify:CR=1 FL=1